MFSTVSFLYSSKVMVERNLKDGMRNGTRNNRLMLRNYSLFIIIGVIMSTELQQVIHSIETSNVRNKPYEHCLIENIFSEDFYEELINNVPNDDEYKPTEYVSETRDGNPTRYKISLKDPTDNRLLNYPSLQKLSKILLSKEIYSALSNLFSNINKSKDVGVNVYLFRDKVGYKLAPHSDASYKIISLIIYLAKNDSYKEVGTIINTKGEDGQFIKYDQVEYKRNSGFAFPVVDTSFHSVDEVTIKNFNRDTVTNFYASDDGFVAPLI